MDNMVTNDNSNVVYYVVRINGQDVSTPYSERMMAEMAKQNLPADQQVIAEVVPVNAGGLELLLE